MEDVRFPQAPLLTIKWCGFPPKLNHKRNLVPFCGRISNAGFLCFYPFWIQWRMPWLPCAAFAKGWDACFRQLNKLGEFSDSASSANKECRNENRPL